MQLAIEMREASMLGVPKIFIACCCMPELFVLPNMLLEESACKPDLHMPTLSEAAASSILACYMQPAIISRHETARDNAPHARLHVVDVEQIARRKIV